MSKATNCEDLREISVSISNLRNELHVYLGGDHLFRINGCDSDEDFTVMSEAEGVAYIKREYQDVIADIAG